MPKPKSLLIRTKNADGTYTLKLNPNRERAIEANKKKREEDIKFERSISGTRAYSKPTKGGRGKQKRDSKGRFA